jgi:NADPH:quinone reductase-like Zn-dependent oxidoreductase
MHAIIQTGYGAPSRVLRLEEVDQPALDDDRVLVRVRASSVNSSDWRQVRAHPYIIRLTLGLRRPRDGHIGGDYAGVVEAVGAKVSNLAVGDEVFGARTGAYADYVAARMAVAKPANLSFEQAAALPVAATTALQAVRDKGAVRAGQRLLVNGAGGGVGHFAVQIAKAFGAEVTATTSTDKIGLVGSLGADHVIDYTREDFTRGTQRYEVIIDCAGNASLGATCRALSDGGRLIVVGAYRRPLTRLALGWLRRRLLRQPILFFLAQIRLEDLQTLKEMAEAGRLRPIIDRTFTLADVPAAIGYAERQTVAGKIVLTVPGQLAGGGPPNAP